MKRIAQAFALIGIAHHCVPASAHAAIIQAYRYDALGRLSTTCQSLAGQAQRTDYHFDKASNRTAVNSSQTSFTLQIDQRITSANGAYYLVMQGDGNLVIYGPSGAVWSTQTHGTSAIQASFQNDGNIVLYSSTRAAIWSSRTSQNLCAHYVLGDNGVLRIIDSADAVVWSSQ